MDIRAVMYLDDGIVAVEGEHKAQEVSTVVQKNLKDSGFITNIEKSNWVPRRLAKWLGFDINMESAQLGLEQQLYMCYKHCQDNWQDNFSVISLRPSCEIHDPGTFILIKYQTLLVSYVKSLTRSCTRTTILVV